MTFQENSVETMISILCNYSAVTKSKILILIFTLKTTLISEMCCFVTQTCLIAKRKQVKCVSSASKSIHHSSPSARHLLPTSFEAIFLVFLKNNNIQRLNLLLETLFEVLHNDWGSCRGLEPVFIWFDQLFWLGEWNG